MPLYTPGGGGTDATLTFSDITTNNSSTTKHGFLKKLDNTATNFMNGAGNWAAPGISAAGLNSGTSFPVGPSTNDLFFRTDLGCGIYRYDGTIWRCTTGHETRMIPRESAGVNIGGDMNIAMSATQTPTRSPAISVLGGSNIYLLSAKTTYIIASGGSALSGSHMWVGTLIGLDLTPASTGTVATLTINSGNSNEWRSVTTAINAAQAAGTLWFQMTWTKTGTPGTMLHADTFAYQHIAT